MGTIRKVLRYGGSGREIVRVEDGATRGARIGTDVYDADGGLFVPVVEHGDSPSVGSVLETIISPKRGVATLIAGTVAIAEVSVAANSLIFLSRTTTGGTVGHLSSVIDAGVDFTINSSSGSDTSTIAWMIIKP